MTDNTIELINNDWPAIKQAIVDNVTDYRACVQAGGHHGTYPKYLAEMFRTVYTFEADPENFKELDKNCHEDNIIAYNKALSAYKRNVGLWRVADGNTGQVFVVPGDDIPATTIDSLKLGACGLIQLDVERHEMYAIIGAIETIETYRPVVILEGPETTNNTCNRILEQLGYDFVCRVGFDSVFKYTGRTPPTTEYV